MSYSNICSYIIHSFSNVVSTLFELGVPRAQFVDSEGWTMANRDEAESK